MSTDELRMPSEFPFKHPMFMMATFPKGQIVLHLPQATIRPNDLEHPL
jgi:hypothetical protein